MICPECGKEMGRGFIRADRAFLLWVERPTWTGKGGEVIDGSDPFTGAHLPVFRCPECRLLLAKYESYDEKVKTLVSGSSLRFQ